MHVCKHQMLCLFMRDNASVVCDVRFVIFFFFVINIFLFFIHNITSKKITKQNNRHILNISKSSQREGEREGQEKHKSHSFIQSRISKRKHCQASMVEGLAPLIHAVVRS